MNRVHFDSYGTRLYGEIIVCSILTLITFGLYAPFAKTRIRKIIWSSTSLADHHFHYSGDPWVLFRSYLIILGVYFIAGSILAWGAEFLTSILAALLSEAGTTVYEYISTGIVFFITNAIWIVVFALGSFLGLRYIAICTSYRNQHANMNQHLFPLYLKKTIQGTLLSIITLGLYIPWLSYQLRKIRIEALSYGHHQFKFKLSQSSYVKHYFIGAILTILTLGLYYPFFRVKMFELMMDNTELGPVQIRSRVDRLDVLGRMILLSIIGILTLGIAFLFADVILLKPFLNSLSVRNMSLFNFGEIAPVVVEQPSGIWQAVDSIIGDGDAGL